MRRNIFIYHQSYHYLRGMEKAIILEVIVNQLLAAVNDETALVEEAIMFQEKLESIKQLKPELYAVLINFINHYQAWEFIRQDYELRHKIKDIWQMQCDYAKNQCSSGMIELKEKCTTLEIKINWPEMEFAS